MSHGYRVHHTPGLVFNQLEMALMINVGQTVAWFSSSIYTVLWLILVYSCAVTAVVYICFLFMACLPKDMNGLINAAKGSDAVYVMKMHRIDIVNHLCDLTFAVHTVFPELFN